MENINRTFLLGAGFSKAVADGPIMQELWSRIKERYEQEKNRITSVDNLRIQWFEDLDSKLSELETLALNKFKHCDNIQVRLRENIEYIFTLIDLSLLAAFIPFSKSELERMKSTLQTFLYLILVNLEVNDLGNQFARVIEENDNIITFNYDLVLEKSLSGVDIWSPLEGYVGACKFEKDEDIETLIKAKKHSKLKIHKMHGSINWGKPGMPELARKKDDILIVMDNLETQGFHFNGLLNRKPVRIKQGFVGRHEPGWMLPSFIKPFDRKEIYEIWQSAINVMSKTDELVIIGYSFRPEDSNAFLLISMLPRRCNIILVDCFPEEIKKRLENKGFKVARICKSLECYLPEK